MTAASGKLPIFISWSGSLSLEVAVILREWLPRVIQDVKPWVSSVDIEKGTYWTEEIISSLDESTVGIVVVTPENFERPWLNFEAGALARSIKATGGTVTPLLIGLRDTSVSGPLTSLQLANFEKADVSKLLSAINRRTRSPLDQTFLDEALEERWPKLEQLVDEALAGKHTKVAELGDHEMLVEVLTGIRELRRQVDPHFYLADPSDNLALRELKLNFLISEKFERHGIKLLGVNVKISTDGLVQSSVITTNEVTGADVRAAVDEIAALGPYPVAVQQMDEDAFYKKLAYERLQRSTMDRGL